MNKNIKSRILEEADYMIRTRDTVRVLAEVFHVSKSTIHKDLKYRLESLDKQRYEQVNDILKYHREVRHLRGGQSTKKKYLNLGI